MNLRVTVSGSHKTNSDKTKCEFDLTDLPIGQFIDLGRDEKCHVVVDNPFVSRTHGQISRSEEGRLFYVPYKSKSSSNDAQCKGHLIVRKEVTHGDIITFINGGWDAVKKQMAPAIHLHFTTEVVSTEIAHVTLPIVQQPPALRYSFDLSGWSGLKEVKAPPRGIFPLLTQPDDEDSAQSPSSDSQCSQGGDSLSHAAPHRVQDKMHIQSQGYTNEGFTDAQVVRDSEEYYVELQHRQPVRANP